jgi:hypothetical protein
LVGLTHGFKLICFNNLKQRNILIINPASILHKQTIQFFTCRLLHSNLIQCFLNEFQFYLFLVIPSFLGVNHVLTQPMLCKIEALAIQFFYLSAMCWLSSMAYDIWCTFRQLRTRPHDNQGRGWRHPRYKW